MTGLIPSKPQSDRGQVRRGKIDDECTLACLLPLLGSSPSAPQNEVCGHRDSRDVCYLWREQEGAILIETNVQRLKYGNYATTYFDARVSVRHLSSSSDAGREEIRFLWNWQT
jgi:hypothetical protein